MQEGSEIKRPFFLLKLMPILNNNYSAVCIFALPRRVTLESSVSGLCAVESFKYLCLIQEAPATT